MNTVRVNLFQAFKPFNEILFTSYYGLRRTGNLCAGSVSSEMVGEEGGGGWMGSTRSVLCTW